MDEKINNVKSRTKQARLMGIKDPKYVDWGNYSSKICGSVGGATDETPTKDDLSSFK
ncbi:alpha/beta-type small acid-soluble spore protein [Clostridium algoriphilum]|uniref:alpha/beta-type small acid-soluble spore protein n=1 Tax=Clostridium algoriphilum TaxID=198347 RepID=UPI001CF431E7|nr:alpha/beta-type small acid-soluble spore protein [Clostridium algoriphilum]MCB2294474.1 alpha/beta-type small acid-soluble spore protein [Clostridium algoriphilum]